ncbi:MAG TPA: adenylate/guanylate cyclase domain-containing protein, partial [Dehalococcoidia bacterium]
DANDRSMALAGRWAVIANTLIRGDMAAANELIDALEGVTEETRMPAFSWQLGLLRAMQEMFSGSMDDAEKASQAALAIGQRATPEMAAQMFGVMNFAIRREQGRTEELEPALKGFVEMYPAVPAWRTALGYYLAERGLIEEAQVEFEPLAKDDFAIFPRDGNWPIAMALLAETAAVIGDKERAEYLYEQMLPVGNRCIVVGAAVDCYGATHRLLGRLAMAMERWEDAERHFEDAIEMNVRMGSGRHLGWTYYQYADMLLRRAGDGDRERALSLLQQALDVAEPRGLTALLERSLALKLTTQGVDSTDLGASIVAVADKVQQERPDMASHAAPDGTVTIMFSDIEGSTAMADRLGDNRFMEVLREHNAIIREQVTAQSGFEVKSEGDGFMVAFQSAAKALACASAIQKAMTDRNETAEEPVKVRIGLHAGEVIKEGEDFFGRNVIMAARVASQAKGGEVLASAVLKTLLSGSDVRWGDARSVELKGLAGVHEIWAVKWAEREGTGHEQASV